MNLFLDSGAFSAWTKNTEVSVEEYTEFALEHLDKFDYIANLDVIPGRWRVKPTYEERQESARKGWDNYQYMRSKGIPLEKLIHIFHQGEEYKWLRRMVTCSMPYIGLSPANDSAPKQKKAFLDDCMKYVCDEDGYPRVKFHGFAVTSIELMMRYPWKSVDSSSWVHYGRYGIVLIPKQNRFTGDYDYTVPPWKVFVSWITPKKSLEEKSYWTERSQPLKSYWRKYIRSKGFSMGRNEGEGKNSVAITEGVSNNNLLRDQMNMIFFYDLEQKGREWPWAFKRDQVELI